VHPVLGAAAGQVEAVLRAGGPLRERWRAGRCSRAGLAARSGLHS